MDAALFCDIAGKLPLGEAVHTLLRDCLDHQRLASAFEKHRGRCYEKIIKFPLIVKLIGDSLMNHGGSAYCTFLLAQEAGELETSKVAAYRKLSCTPIPLSMAFFTGCNQTLLDTFPEKARRQSPKCLQNIETLILDGKAIKKDEWACVADFRLTSWQVCWSLAITERLTLMSNHRTRVHYSGEEKVFILRAHFVEGLLQKHVQLKKANGAP
jgi:hypothetical protein